ncbi:hypothetical protein, partial [uncultured Gammaproteobacteria bacterium]
AEKIVFAVFFNTNVKYKRIASIAINIDSFKNIRFPKRFDNTLIHMSLMK